MPLVSVALCTYNGARYLGEQLASIAAQTHPVDELVICDDRSTDDTSQIVAEFARTAPFPVCFQVNETNLGSTKNFEKAVLLCQGDLILFSDQDDRWRADRVSKTLTFFRENPTMEGVFSNARIMDSNSHPTNRTIWDKVQFTKILRKKWRAGLSYEILYNGYVVTGATLAIRKLVLPLALPFPAGFEELIHDGWLALVLALRGTIGFLDDELIWYRQHTAQQVGFGKQIPEVSMRDRFIRSREEKLLPLKKRADELALMYNLLRAKPELPAEKLVQLRCLRDHYRMRATLPRNRWHRLAPIWRDVQRGWYVFSRPDHWWRPAMGDLFE
ncbi:MAG: glycosyltransferase family 2 protein [Cytophagaceae bacterium]|nr:glycosyltransferase family 2 protein [Cytophagaceae bacterium]